MRRIYIAPEVGDLKIDDACSICATSNACGIASISDWNETNDIIDGSWQ